MSTPLSLTMTSPRWMPATLAGELSDTPETMTPVGIAGVEQLVGDGRRQVEDGRAGHRRIAGDGRLGARHRLRRRPAELQCRLVLLAVAHDAERGGAADAQRRQPIVERADDRRPRSPSIDGDHVVGLQMRRRRRPVGATAATSTPPGDGSRMASAMSGVTLCSVAPSHGRFGAWPVAAARNHGTHQIRRDGEADAGGAAGRRDDHAVDADELAVHVDQGAAGIARIDGGVGLDEILVLATGRRAHGQRPRRCRW